MKRLLMSLAMLLLTSRASAGGGGWENDDGPDACLPMLGILIGGVLILMVGGYVHHVYKMQTDPEYRKDWKRRSREIEEDHRRNGF